MASSNPSILFYYEIPWMPDRVSDMQILTDIRAGNPTSFEALKASLESVLELTEWPLESNGAAQRLLKNVQRKPHTERLYDLPERATRAMQIVWQRVKEASLTYGLQDRGPIRKVTAVPGGGAEGCTRVLTACLGELPSFLSEKTRYYPPLYLVDSDDEQQRVSSSSEGSAVSIPSTTAMLGRNTVVRQQEAIARAHRIRHKALPPTPRDDGSQHSWSNPRAGSLADTPSLRAHRTLVVVNRDPDSEEEDLAVPLHSDSRQALRLRGDERQQHRSSLGAGRSPPSRHTHKGLMGALEYDSNEENAVPSRHMPRPLMGAVEEKGSVVSISSSSASPDSVADVGSRITWISPTPVRANGRFFDVFVGTHSRVGKVALKRPRVGAPGNRKDVKRIRRLRREAETWERLLHPHILPCLGTFHRDGHFYFVSPFIENGTLVKYIARHPSVNRIKLLCETADAINYLHKEGVVHGDIKASNILIADNGQVLLCDFGLTSTTDSRTSTVMDRAGALRWQSPELWSGGSKSFKSDVYSFGMTIAEVLTGKVPFPDLQTDDAVIRAVLIEEKRPPKNPTESSAGLSYEKVWSVAEACWPAAPEERISMSEALQRIQEDPALAVMQKI